MDAIYKLQDYVPGDYDYVKPKHNSVLVDKDIKKGDIKKRLQEFSKRVEVFQVNWKENKYKVVNSKNNTISNLNNTNKGNVTKALKDLADLISKF